MFLGITLKVPKATGAQRGGTELHDEHLQGPQVVSRNLRSPQVSKGHNKASERTPAFAFFILGPWFGVPILAPPHPTWKQGARPWNPCSTDRLGQISQPSVEFYYKFQTKKVCRSRKHASARCVGVEFNTFLSTLECVEHHSQGHSLRNLLT